MNTYTSEQKKQLAKRIESVKKSEDLAEIYKIIKRDNPVCIENANGSFMHFHKLRDETYNNLENYLNTIKKTPVQTLSMEYTPYSNEDESNEYSDSKLRFSNKEKNLIKRKKQTSDSDDQDTKFDFNN